MPNRFEAIKDVYAEQHHHGGTVVDILANTYENFDNLLRGVTSPSSQVRIDQRDHVASATTGAIGDIGKSIREGKLLRALGDVLIGVPGAMIKDGKDAMLAKSGESVIVRHAA